MPICASLSEVSRGEDLQVPSFATDAAQANTQSCLKRALAGEEISVTGVDAVPELIELATQAANDTQTDQRVLQRSGRSWIRKPERSAYSSDPLLADDISLSMR